MFTEKLVFFAIFCAPWYIAALFYFQVLGRNHSDNFSWLLMKFAIVLKNVNEHDAMFMFFTSFSKPHSILSV